MITGREALLVFLGGGIGSLARYGVALALPKPATGGFPLGILMVNVAGCFALGLLVGWIARHPQPSHALAAFVGVGLCGGFTTFSTFGIDALELLTEGRSAAALGYVAASVGLGIGAAALGASAAR